MFCPRCGSNENDSVKFCTNCGFMLSSAHSHTKNNSNETQKKVQTAKIKDITNNEYTSSKFNAKDIKRARVNNDYQKQASIQNDKSTQVEDIEATTILEELDEPIQNNNYSNQNNFNQIDEVEATTVLEELDEPIQNNNYSNQNNFNQIDEVEATTVLEELDVPIQQSQQNDDIKSSDKKYNYADLLNTRNSYTSSPMPSSQENLLEVTEILDDLEEPLVESNSNSENQINSNFSAPVNISGIIDNNSQQKPDQNPQSVPVPYNTNSENEPVKEKNSGKKAVYGIFMFIISVVVVACLLIIDIKMVFDIGFENISKDDTIKKSGILTEKINDNDSLSEILLKSTNIKFSESQIKEFAEKSTLSGFLSGHISKYGDYINGDISQIPEITLLDIKSLLLLNIPVIESITGETFTNQQVQSMLNNIDNGFINSINNITLSNNIIKFIIFLTKYFIPIIAYVGLFFISLLLFGKINKSFFCYGIITLVIGIITLSAGLVLPLIFPQTAVGTILFELFSSKILLICLAVQILLGIVMLILGIVLGKDKKVKTPKSPNSNENQIQSNKVSQQV